jgi:AraC-like DNA-binding protein
MSPRNTQKILKKLYGVTFSEKIAEIKLNIATQKMIDTDLPLSEISKIAGYNQYPTFRRAFIKEYGVSPSEYREKERKEIP